MANMKISNIKMDFKNCGFTDEEILEHADVVEDIDNELNQMTKDESAFCGWLKLPSTYINSDEYKKIKTAANKIKKDSDILLVIGIGGSYLGARAVVEALHSSIYEMDKTKTHVIFVGNSLSPNYINDVIDLLQNKDFSINVISKS